MRTSSHFTDVHSSHSDAKEKNSIKITNIPRAVKLSWFENAYSHPLLWDFGDFSPVK